MLKVYNYMASALALTGLVAYLVAHTPALMQMLYAVTPRGIQPTMLVITSYSIHYTKLYELAVHVDEVLRTRALVQVVDVLGDQQHFARPFAFEPRERLVRRVRHHLGVLQTGAAGVVELLHARGVAREGFSYNFV